VTKFVEVSLHTAKRDRGEADNEGPHDYQQDGWHREVYGRPTTNHFDDIKPMTLDDII